MPYFAYGRDQQTDEPMRRIYCEKSDELAARAEAESKGMRVTSVVPCSEDQKPGEIVASASPVSGSVPGAGLSSRVVVGAQREAIAGIARYMRIVGIFLALTAAITIVAGFSVRRMTPVIQGIVELVVAVITIRTAGCFRRVGDGRDGDPQPMTEALESLRSLYLFQAMAIAAAVAIIVLVVVGALLSRAA